MFLLSQPTASERPSVVFSIGWKKVQSEDSDVSLGVFVKMFSTDVLLQWNLGTLAMLFYNTYKSEQEDLGLKQKDNPCCSVGVIIPPNGAGNDLWIFPVKPIRWKKIINSHNVLCRHLIAFPLASYCSAPHFTLRFSDSINALCSTCSAPPWASAGNWIGVSSCCNTQWRLLTIFLVCFSFKCWGEKKHTYKEIKSMCEKEIVANHFWSFQT